MYPNNKNMMWLAVLLFIAAVAGYNFFISHKAPSTNQDQSPLQNTDRIENEQNSVKPPPPAAESPEIKTYKSSEYEFEFTYPASFGTVTVKTYECPKGFLAVGTFDRNPNIDFGYVSSIYQRCKDLGLVLSETLSFDVLGKKLKLYNADTTKPAIEVTVEQTIRIPSPDFTPYTAYVIKNTVEAAGNGDPTAILGTPNPDIGALIFRTHHLPYQDGVNLLEAVIK